MIHLPDTMRPHFQRFSQIREVKLKTRFLGQVAAMLLCFSLSAHAAYAVSPAVDLTEKSLWDSGSYVLTNNSSSSIQAFAVSNSTRGYDLLGTPGWLGASYSEAEWNTSYWTKGLGSFTSLFGTTDRFANFYLALSPAYSIGSGQTSGVFSFSGPAASEYVAWDIHGNVIYQSLTAQVPEPETYALMLVGLGMMGATARRRKNKQA